METNRETETGERQTERDRERQTETERDRQRETERDRETDRQTDGRTDRQTEVHAPSRTLDVCVGVIHEPQEFVPVELAGSVSLCHSWVTFKHVYGYLNPKRNKSVHL